MSLCNTALGEWKLHVQSRRQDCKKMSYCVLHLHTDSKPLNIFVEQFILETSTGGVLFSLGLDNFLEIAKYN